MTVSQYVRRSNSGTAAATTLSGSIGSGDSSFILVSASGWPDGSGGNFYAVIESEVLDCSARTSTTVTVANRGCNGTSAAAHAAGVAVTHDFTATDADEANKAVAEIIGKATTVGQVPVVSGANAYTMLQAKTAAQILLGNGTTLASVAVTGDVTINSSGVTVIGSGKVTSGMLLDGTIVNADINASAAIALSKLASDPLARANHTGTQVMATISDAGALATLSAVGSAQITDGSIATGDIAALAITTALINTAAVTNAKLAANVPLGLLAAPVSVTSDDAGVISSTYVDLASLTRTVTVGTNRYIEVEGFAHFTSGTANDELVFAIREGSTVIESVSYTHVSGSAYTPTRVKFTIIDPSSGSHTYKLSAKLGTGTGPFTMHATSSLIATMTVADVGGH